jgi:polysaccharide export outer membrane protein
MNPRTLGREQPWPARGIALLLTGLAAFLVLPGCYTRVTTPQSTFTYYDSRGNLVQSRTATIVSAPQYLAVLRERGITPEDEYVLPPGIRINVEVYGHDIERTVNVRPDGYIDLPLVGDVQAIGRTVFQFKNDISERYRQYFVDPPQVIVNTETTEFGEKIQAGEVAVLNPTGRQGVITLTGDDRLSRVLARAETLHDKSEWQQIAVIRQGKATGDRYVILCDIQRLVFLGDLDQDIQMRNGDLVFVPFEIDTWLEEFVETFQVAGDVASDFQTIADFISTVEGY